ncbi:MAG: pirin family protein [Planctomycetota bacterium]
MLTNTLQFEHRPARERGQTDFGWLKSKHSFSFGQYQDANRMGFANLRVINDDLVEGGKGFGEHPHQNAEIFSYMLDGALEHKDSLGNGSVVSAGGVQYMSAGSGVRHSEFNPSPTDAMRFLQVWLLPHETGTPPRYETLDIKPAEKDGRFKLFLSRDGRDGSMTTQADANVYVGSFDGDQELSWDLQAPRKGWVQVANGSLLVNSQPLSQGDGLAIEGEGTLVFSQGQRAEVLFFELSE